MNGYYKAEIIYEPTHNRSCKRVDEVELVTLGWVHRHNTTRLHGYLGDLPPGEFEATFKATERTDQHLVEIQ